MQPDIFLVWFGALLVLCGILFTAAKALGRGRLSEPHPLGSTTSDPTLEPRGRNAGLRLKGHLPGLAFIGIGAMLLLIGSVV